MLNRCVRRASLAALVVCLIGLGATKPPHTLTFLHPDSIDVVALLPAPPARDSMEEKSEFATLERLGQTRSEADIARAQSEEKFSVFIFSDVLGKDFSEATLPATKAFFDKLDSDSKFFTSNAKDHWNRKRPPFIDSALSAKVKLEDEPSYPSGHAARGSLFALVLAEIEPEHRDALIARGQTVGWDRVIASVHYPSDVAAGRVLGQAEFNALMKAPAFVEALDAVKKEIHAHSASH